MALDQYGCMSGPDGRWFYEEDPQTYLTEIAEAMVSMEWDASDPETGEMFPDWCALVLTPAIVQTIDWECVRAAVIEMYEEQEIDYMFGEDESEDEDEEEEPETANCYGCLRIYNESEGDGGGYCSDKCYHDTVERRKALDNKLESE